MAWLAPWGPKRTRPDASRSAHLLPVQRLGQRLLRAVVGQAIEVQGRQGFQTLQKVQQRQAAALPIRVIAQCRQRAPQMLQAFDQVQACLFAMAVPQGFADAFPPEALAAANEIGGEKDARRHLVFLQQRERVHRVVAPAVVEGQRHSRPLGAAQAWVAECPSAARSRNACFNHTSKCSNAFGPTHSSLRWGSSAAGHWPAPGAASGSPRRRAIDCAPPGVEVQPATGAF